MAFGGSLVQSSVVPSWSLGGVTPDLPLILTVLVALRRGPEALSRALAGFAMGLLPGRLWVGHPLIQIPGFMLLTVAEGFLRFGVLQLFHFPATLGGLLTHVILPQALYNGFAGAACVLAIEAVRTLSRRHTWI